MAKSHKGKYRAHGRGQPEKTFSDEVLSPEELELRELERSREPGPLEGTRPVTSERVLEKLQFFAQQTGIARHEQISELHVLHVDANPLKPDIVENEIVYGLFGEIVSVEGKRATMQANAITTKDQDMYAPDDTFTVGVIAGSAGDMTDLSVMERDFGNMPHGVDVDNMRKTDVTVIDGKEYGGLQWQYAPTKQPEYTPAYVPAHIAQLSLAIIIDYLLKSK